MDFNDNDNDEDEREIPTVLYCNEDYMDTSVDELNNLIAQFQRLNINDQPPELQSETRDIPCVPSVEISRSVEGKEKTSMSDINRNVSPKCIITGNWQSEVTKVVIDEENFPSSTDETKQGNDESMSIDTNNPKTIQPEDIKPISSEKVIHKVQIFQSDKCELEGSKEMKESKEENTSDVSSQSIRPTYISDHDYAAELSSAASEFLTDLQSTVSEFLTDLQSTKAVTEETKQTDAETGEVSNILSSDDRVNNSLLTFSSRMAKNICSEIGLRKQLDSADASYDFESCVNSSVVSDSAPETHKSDEENRDLVEVEGCRKNAALFPPASQTNTIKQRRFGVFQGPSNIAETETSRPNSTSDEDSKKQSTIGEDSPRKRHRKVSMSSPSNDKHSGKRNISSKRKKSASENMETSEKIRKRSITESTSGTGSKTNLLKRSRSVSLNLTDTNPSGEISPIRLSRKRTSSMFENAPQAKPRRSSNSSDDAKNI